MAIGTRPCWPFPFGDYPELADSLNWRTGALLVTAGLPKEGRSSALFVHHLQELWRRLLCYRKIYVICHNACIHYYQRVRQYLQYWDRRICLHFLPLYTHGTNPN